MTEDQSLSRKNAKPIRFQVLGTALLTTALAATCATPAFADIDNTAEAQGTYNATTVTSPTDDAHVPVAPASPVLTVTKTADAPVDTTGDGVIGPGDTITFHYTVKNDGNVTINNAMPVDAGPTFNQVAGSGTMGAFSPASANLAPGVTQSFTADYVMSAADAYNAAGIAAVALLDSNHAVENTATATGTPTAGTLAAVTPANAETSIPANPLLQITKTWAFKAPGGDVDGDGFADKDDIVIYTYEIANTGNVAVTNAQVNDTHEGTLVAIGGTGITNETQVSAGPVGSNSGGASSTDGIWDNLTAGSVIRFTYEHTVTQAEVDGG